MTVSYQDKPLYRAYKGLRSALERVPILRSVIAHSVEIKNTLLDDRRAEKNLLDEFYTEEDPYGFERPEEAIRFERGLQMLEEVRGADRFGRAFEIGCSEGKFTAMLASRCENLLGVDLSERALDRARRRCSDFTNIDFAVWNLRYDVVPGKFNLILAIGVVEYVRRPSAIAVIRERMVSAIDPGGYLLIGTTVSDRQNTWLGRKLLRGTTIDDFFAAHPQLETVSRSVDECAMAFEHVLLRKT